MNPYIRIKNGWLLQGMITEFLSQIPNHTYGAALDPAAFKALVEDRQALWKDEADLILAGMRSITGLEFRSLLVDVYIVQQTNRAFSDPLVIDARYSGSSFIDTLTHEILHRLLTDNTAKIDTSAWVKAYFPEIRDAKTINHIMVHAVHEAIYKDILWDPVRLDADIAMCKNSPGYKESWKLVQHRGYRTIIQEFKKAHNLS
jgi:hypothetical protein